MTRAAWIGGVAVAVLVTASIAGAAARPRGVTTEVSGVMPESAVAISANGRYVVFAGGAVDVLDRRTGHTAAADVTPDGGVPDGPSGENLGAPYFSPVGISGDGRFVAFTSWASNLVAGESGGFIARVFVRDMTAGVTSEVGPGYFAAISADGRTVAFTDMSGFEVRNLVSGETTTVTNAVPSAVSLSADGRFVAFSSWSPGPTSQENVFVRDLTNGVTSLVSVARDRGPTNGNSGTPAISASGRYVAFESDASNLVRGDKDWFRDVFVRDLLAGTTTRVSVASNGAEGWDPGACTLAGSMDDNGVAISADGRFVAFTSCLQDLVQGDENYASDVFVRDRLRGVTSLISVTRNGGTAAGQSEGPLAISPHGRVVAFGSGARNLVAHPKRGWGVFIRDLRADR
jgi:hypothetical protein